MRMAMVVALVIGIGATADAGERTVGGHKLLLVQMDGDALKVIQVDQVAQPLPRRRGPEKSLPWRYKVEAADGRVVHTARFEDPTLVRGEFHARDGSGRIEPVRFHQKGKVTFTIRVPATGADRVVVQRLKAGTPRQPVQPASAWEKVGELDLAKAGGGR